MLIVKVNDDAAQSVLNSLVRRMNDMTPAMRDIGEALAAGTRQRFFVGSDWDGATWAPNAPATLARKKSGRVLVGETKALFATIHYRASANAVSLGSPMEYAATQHFGALRGAFGRTVKNTPIPWGNIPPRPFLPVNRDGSMPQAAANLVVSILRDYLDPDI